jgi:hypothetical protein
MLAAGTQDCKDHEVRIRKQPLLGFRTSGLGGACQRSKVPIPGQCAQVVQADTRQAGDLLIGKNLLARLDSHHFSASPVSMLAPA